MNLTEIQEQLRTEQLDGWLFFDHHLRDPIAYHVLGLEAAGHVSRRWYYWIPAHGDPVKLVHCIEDGKLDSLPGERLRYSAWSEQHKHLKSILRSASKVAMQYSPNCMIPYVSLVDGGTVDLVRSFGKEVASSASLVQYFEARWSADQLESHYEAGRRVDETLAEAFAEIGRQVSAAGSVQELTIADFIRKRFADRGVIAADGPIVAVNANSGNPHYAPTQEQSVLIQAGDFVLIDLWAKLDQPRSVYYDITWTGFVGEQIPSDIQNVFEVVRGGRDAAIEAARAAIRSGEPYPAFQLDDVTRSFISAKGFGEAFVHRTGHSIGKEVHGNGANIDNLETRDERPIIPRTCFSIEPGVYLPKFGVRTEIDCYVSEDDAGPTGRVQTEIVRIHV